MPFATLNDYEFVTQNNFQYDFIVVGAGSAGCALASRLSEDRSVTVLLIEAGPRSHNAEDSINCNVPAAAGKIQHSKTMDWGYYAEPQAPTACTALNTFKGANPKRKYCSYWPRGKGLGGSSQLNYMAWVRGHPNDYNDWETKHGCEGWGWDTSIQKLFEERIENHYGLTYKNPTCSLASQFLEACEELGHPKGNYNADFDANKGIAGLHQTSVRKGTRCTASRAYIEPLLAEDSSSTRRPNLTVLTAAKCTRVITETKEDGKLVAIGVEVVPDTGRDEEDSSFFPQKVMCSKEVILSAGAIGSPHILLQSGIGPNGTTLHSPMVGQNLLDHYWVMLRFPPKDGQGKQDIGSVNTYKAEGIKSVFFNFWDCFINHKGMLTSPAYDASLFFTNEKDASPSSAGKPNLQISCMCSPTDQNFMQGNVGMDTDQFELDSAEFSDAAEGLIFCAILLHPESKGTVTMNDKDEVVIHANYATDPKSHDIKNLIACIKKALQIANTKPYQSVVRGAPFWPKDLLSKYNLPGNYDDKIPAVDDYSDEFLEEYIRRFATTLYHPTSTCKMGPKQEAAVVDPNLKVYGVDNLRVADASIQPFIVSGNTQASCVVIGEKAADILQKEHNLQTNPNDLVQAVDQYEANMQKKRQLVAGGLLASVAAVAVVAGVSMTKLRGF